MKLRNKKTGEITEGQVLIKTNFHKDAWCCESMAELFDHWEDAPVEPLIKDEKVRKAVRAWAEANNLSGASTYKSCSDSHYWYIRAFDDTEKGIDIDIWGELPKELIDCKYYTIAELCGEEEG